MAATIIIRVTVTSEIVSLSNNLIRIKSSCINSSLFILHKMLILSLDNIAASKSIAVNKTSLRRDLIKLDFIPTIFAHKALKHFNTLTEGRKSLTILLVVHMESFTSLIGKSTRLRARSILTLQPLGKKRRSLALNIQHKLLTHQLKSISLKLSVNELIEIIPTTKLGHKIKITTHSISLVVSKPTSYNTEETTLTLTTTHVAQIEQALESIYRILIICVAKKHNAISIATSTICSTHAEQVKKTRHSALMGQSAIFSIGIIGRILHSIEQSIHIFFSFFTLISLGQENYFLMERDTRFELAPPAWKAGMLTINTNPA